jgi:hypothetical protein
MDEKQPTYFSYLLRLWRDDEPVQHRERKTIWLASLESSLTGERQGFASLDDLVAFLRRETCAVCDDENQENKTTRQ